MRVLAIGDIHGCSRALDCLLAAVDPQARETVITLGDYVDRGPDSCGVIDRLLRLQRMCHLVALRGNHELMMLAARDGEAEEKEWHRNGGDVALASYSVLGDVGKLVDVPEHHWQFLEEKCVGWYETESHFFVHANAYPELTLAEQPDYMLYWEQFNDPPPHSSGKVMVCGHTPQKSGRPLSLGHAICIDTWVYGRGWLSCLDVTTGRIWQANQSGEQRTCWMDDCTIDA
jgi:serine/threonine protein phosphatase 1